MQYLTEIPASVIFMLPQRKFFQYPPDVQPKTLLPPPYQGTPTWQSPFPVPATLFHATFHAAVPITFAAVYFTAVVLLNQANRRAGFQKWRIARTRGFFYFKIFHNVFLSLYSLITFIGISRALHVSIPALHEHGMPGIVDALCKLHGPGDFGSAITYDPQSHTWIPTNHSILLAANGTPSASNMGRIWNEGLAFWGWLFYLSKFYEVVDTALIIMNGKRSTTLQTYHHAGAMFAMWAGMRYMSPPIWMFVCVNSLIHTLMYSYYTVTTLGIKVPIWFKTTLTTMQISQFVIGVFYAFLHLWIAYRVPVSIPVGAAATSTLGKAASLASAAAGFNIPPWAKKLLFRASGSEALAQNVLDETGNVFGPEHRYRLAAARSAAVARQEQFVNCIDTNGQSFGIWLNMLYLTPLTMLFLRFFIKSYVLGDPKDSSRRRGRSIEKSVQDAVRKTSHTIETMGEQAERSTSPLSAELVRVAEIRADQESLRREAAVGPAEHAVEDEPAANGTVHGEKDKGKGRAW